MSNISHDRKAGWFKAEASGGNGGDCVEVNFDDVSADGSAGTVRVRDSKNPAGGVLSFRLSEWRAFMDGAQKGEFNI